MYFQLRDLLDLLEWLGEDQDNMTFTQADWEAQSQAIIENANATIARVRIASMIFGAAVGSTFGALFQWLYSRHETRRKEKHIKEQAKLVKTEVQEVLKERGKTHEC